MLREGFAEDKERSKGGEGSVPESLTWSVCAIGTGESRLALFLVILTDPHHAFLSVDPTVGLRLFVGYQKGLSKIYTFHSGLAGWEHSKKQITFNHDSLQNPLSSFIIDWETGDQLVPNAERLQGQFASSPLLALLSLPFSR
jgi:hypothetical protein